MTNFNDLYFYKTSNNGIRATKLFDNGYGVSIIKSDISYGGKEGLYELAVIDYHGKILYDTDITKDVIGYLEKNRINKLLLKIEKLENIQEFKNKIRDFKDLINNKHILKF